MIEQAIILRSPQHFGRRIPFESLDSLPKTLCNAVRQSVRMAIEGRSKARGKRPDWLKAAADIRFLGHDGDDETVLHFESPTLGEAAPRIYAQQQLWSTRPSAEETGFDVLSAVLTDVGASNADSERFDRPLLESVARFGKTLNDTFSELVITGGRHRSMRTTSVTPAV